MFRSIIRAVLRIAILTTAAIASPLVVNRGLPTENLNNAPGGSRSNVVWPFASVTSSDDWLAGDTLKNTNSQPWTIDSIRLWTQGETDTAVLRGGIDGSNIDVIPDTSSLHQGTPGSIIAMHQIDFMANIPLSAIAAGQGISVPLSARAAGQGTSVPFVHAPNVALSGFPQDAGDDILPFVNFPSGVVEPLSIDPVNSATPGSGSDKPSDVGVQVLGNAVPEPAALTLFGLGLVALVVTRRKNQV